LCDYDDAQSARGCKFAIRHVKRITESRRSAAATREPFSRLIERRCHRTPEDLPRRKDAPPSVAVSFANGIFASNANLRLLATSAFYAWRTYDCVISVEKLFPLRASLDHEVPDQSTSPRLISMQRSD